MNNTYGILEWNNENSVSCYPLSRLFTPADFIVDATFVQFDAFVPILKSVAVSQGVVTITITTDAGDIVTSIDKPSSSYTPGYIVKLTSNNRHLGFLVFGQGLVSIFNTYIETTIKANIPFDISTVRGISSKAGVYSIAGYTGDVNIYTGDSKPQQTLFFDISGNNVTWNAGSLATAADAVALMTLNGVTPINNAVFIEDSTLIKLAPRETGLLVSVNMPLSNNIVSPITRYE